MKKEKYLEEYAEVSLEKDLSGHDFKHAKRVLKIALKIAKHYKNLDYGVLTSACWLHDISYKRGFVKNHHLVSAQDSEEILQKAGFSKDKIKKIKIAIEDHVGQTAKPVRKNSELQIESKILRDADNIDALGKIGIERQISFCKSHNIPLFKSKKDKFNDSAYGGIKEIIHWADNMLTKEGKMLAKQQVKVMKSFLRKLEKKYDAFRIPQKT
jgi:uncharacterized protein